MKKSHSIFLLLVLLLIVAAPALANNDNLFNKPEESSGISILLDKQVMNTNPISYIDLESNQTLVPVRFVSESLNAKVKWDQENHKITVIQDKKTIVMNIDSRDVYIDGNKKTLAQGVSPKLVKGSTMVPLRFLSETFGYQVGYDEEKKMPTIITQQEVPENIVLASTPSSGLYNTAYTPLVNDFSEIILAESLRQEGIPYAAGGDNPSSGFDCSGLVQWNYKKAGINLPRTAKDQWLATEEVSSDQAQVGDLIFFKGTYGDENHISHVGIYVDESRMHHSNASGVGYSNWNNSYWKEHFDSIRRVKL